MKQEYKKIIGHYLFGMVWFFCLLWPVLGIHEDGTLSFKTAGIVWLLVFMVTASCLGIYIFHKAGGLKPISRMAGGARNKIVDYTGKVPKKYWLGLVVAAALVLPAFTERYGQDVAISVLVYICLGLGLNIVIGLAGMLDLGYIAFYGVGAYTYALLSVNYGIPFWLCLPIAACTACIAGCIIGYPTLRMRGDYLAIVTLGFGEIVRIILNNWMSLTRGPNGIDGISAPGLWVPVFENGFGFEHIWLKKYHLLYYVILALCIFTVVAVYRLNFSRIGRAWEAIREDETAAELMGVDTFKLKLLAYAMGAVFGGLAGAFFAAKTRFVSPESFTFIESAMVLCMVVLGGMASIPGIILGAAALIILPEVFREFELYRMLAFGAVMVLMMVFRPAGLIPAKRMGRRSEETEG